MTRQDDLFGLLANDVDFLATALGDVLKELEGRRLFELVERVRHLTKGLRAGGGADAARELDELLASLDTATAEKLVRAFTVYFQLVNLAEEVHRVRVNRHREAGATLDEPRSESLAAAIRELERRGWTRQETADFLRDLDLQLTVTAHPTEVKRYTVRLKIERIGEALRRLQAGRVIGIFVQGTRNAGDAAALDGAAFLAQRAGTPLLPAAIWREGRNFRVAFGPALAAAGTSRADATALTTRVMQEINALIPG